MRPDQIKKTAEEFDVSIGSAIKARIRYLLGLIDRWIAYIDEQTNVPPESDTMAALDEIIRLRAYEGRLKRGFSKQSITDDQIQAALEYPIERLFDFGRSSRIPCPFHNSKGPDLSYHAKTNTVRCFGACGKSWNPINVLMDLEGRDFISAVKHLAGA